MAVLAHPVDPLEEPCVEAVGPRVQQAVGVEPGMLSFEMALEVPCLVRRRFPAIGM